MKSKEYQYAVNLESEPEFIIQVLTNFHYLNWFRHINTTNIIDQRHYEIIDHKKHIYQLAVTHYKYPGVLQQGITGKYLTGKIDMYFNSLYPKGGTELTIHITLHFKNIFAKWLSLWQLRIKKNYPLYILDLKQELGEKNPQAIG